MKEADRLGLTISGDAAAARAEEFNDNLTRIKPRARSWRFHWAAIWWTGWARP